MSILHVRNVPNELYARIQRLAHAKDRSMSAQVIQLLEHALQAEEARQSQAKTLSGIRRRRVSYTPRPAISDSVTLLQEDRER